MTVVLTNTTPGGTLIRGDVMTGVAWNLALGLTPVLTFPTVGLTNGTDSIFTTKLLSNTVDPLNGSYTNQLGGTPISQYGVATTGFGGAFAAGTITRGTGGEDYGIVADGTFPAPPGSGTSGSFNASAFPLIQNSLTFTFTGATGLLESQIQSVRLLYGTSGTGIIVAVPEPSSYISIAMGLAAIAGRRALRRRAAVSTIEPSQSPELS